MPARPRRRRRIVLLVLLLSSIALTTFGCCADRLILPPVPKNVRPDTAERRLIQRNAGALEAFVAKSPGALGSEPQAFVLRFTGDAAGAAVYTAGRWRHRAVEAWVVNYPGYGKSDGP